MIVDDEGALEESGPTRRSVVRAGALGLAAWSVPTIRPIARTALPGSKPPSTTFSTVPPTVLGNEVPVSDDPGQESTASVVDDGGTGELDVSDPARPVRGEPDFTG